MRHLLLNVNNIISKVNNYFGLSIINSRGLANREVRWEAFQVEASTTEGSCAGRGLLGGAGELGLGFFAGHLDLALPIEDAVQLRAQQDAE